jgi:hypothetical protein
MHTYGFGQAQCRDLLKRVPRNFISYFYEFYFIFYVFLMSKRIFGIFIQKKEIRNWKIREQ